MRLTYGPSVHVNTCGKPHDRTRASGSSCGSPMVGMGLWSGVVDVKVQVRRELRLVPFLQPGT